MNEYILQDRTTADKWAISIADGQIRYQATEDSAQSEPIVEDIGNPGTFWKIFIDDGQLGVEETETEQNDIIILTDTITGQNWKLFVNDGQFGYLLILEQEGFLFRDDDDDEENATPLANQDTNITRAKGLNTRLRFLINASGNPSSKQFQLEYRKKGVGDWKKIT